MEDKNQKTVVAFIAGLLIGGLLVWVFSVAPGKKNNNALDTQGTTTDEQGAMTASTSDTNVTGDKGADTKMTNTTTMPATTVATGAGSIVVEDQKAGWTVALGAVTMPVANGWLVVHDTNADGSLGKILGAARYSSKEGLKPTAVSLLRATVAGKTYAVVVYSENGDHVFDPKNEDKLVMTADGKSVSDMFKAE